MIQIYTGDGKGKTTAAVGLAVRAHGSGLRVCVVFFDKNNSKAGSGSTSSKPEVLQSSDKARVCGGFYQGETVCFERLGIQYYVFGAPRMSSEGKFRFGNTDADRAAAAVGIVKAREVTRSGKYDLVVLDELLTGVSYGLVKSEDFFDILNGVPTGVELVVTGRCNDEKLLERADLVSRVTKVRHYFDAGCAARPGIEY